MDRNLIIQQREMLRRIFFLFPLILLIFIPSLLTEAKGKNKFSEGVKADKVIVEKDARRLILLSNGKVLKTYKVSLGRNPEGPKIKQGDGKTPEGIYTIDYRNPQSQYHLSLHISYPNQSDIKKAQEIGSSPGGDIMLHGIKNGFGWVGRLHRFFDWTDGCIAVTNKEIEEIWNLVLNGTEIEIKP